MYLERCPSPLLHLILLHYAFAGFKDLPVHVIFRTLKVGVDNRVLWRRLNLLKLPLITHIMHVVSSSDNYSTADPTRRFVTRGSKTVRDLISLDLGTR